jgi:hypothetical protein
MVAPSFQNMTKITEPYIKTGKMYIDVKNEKTGTIRSVRWYNDAEYRRQYGKAGETSAYTQELANSLKTARGFLKGPITLIRGTKSSDESWLASVKACYAVDTGWYFRSTDSQPTDLSSHFKLMKLSWEEFTSDGVHKRPNEEVINIIKQKEKRGEWIGS